MSIRSARPSDASGAAPLILAAADTVAYTLTGAKSEDTVLAVLAQFFQAEGNRLSYQNALVKEHEGQVVGVVIAYDGRDATVLDRPLIDRLHLFHNDPSLTLDPETGPDEFYIDTLSVASVCVGQGIGSALLAAIEQRAKASGHTIIALNVDPDNERAFRLYRRLGYVTGGYTKLYGHEYHHMIKLL